MIEERRQAGKLAKGTRGAGRPNIGGADRAPPKETVPSLSDLGIDKHLANRMRRAARMPDDKFEADLAKTVERVVAATEGRAAHR